MKITIQNIMNKTLAIVLSMVLISVMMPTTVMAGDNSNNRTPNDTTINKYIDLLSDMKTEWMEIEIDSNPTIGFRAVGAMFLMKLNTQEGDSFTTGDLQYDYNALKVYGSYKWNVTPTSLGKKVIIAGLTHDFKSWNIEVVHTHTITYLNADGSEIEQIKAKQTADTTPLHTVKSNDSYSSWEVVSKGSLYGDGMPDNITFAANSEFNVVDDITLKGIEKVEEHTLTVVNGEGSGTYEKDAVVDIKTSSPIDKDDDEETTEIFKEWQFIGTQVGNITDSTKQNTTFTMGAGDAEIEAVYTYGWKQNINYYNADGTLIKADPIEKETITSDKSFHGNYQSYPVDALEGSSWNTQQDGFGDTKTPSDSWTTSYKNHEDINLYLIEPEVIEDLSIVVSKGNYGYETIDGKLSLIIDVIGGKADYHVTSNIGNVSTDVDTGDGTLSVSTPGEYEVTVTDGANPNQEAEVRFRIHQVSFDSDGGTQVSYQLLKLDPISSSGTGVEVSTGELEDGGTTFLSLPMIRRVVAKEIELPVATRPTDPSKTDYIFMDWYTSEDNGVTLSEKPYDFDSQVTSDFTLYAKWAEDMNGNKKPDDQESTVTVIYNDGVEDEVIFDDQIETGILEGQSPKPFEGETTRDGYNFIGFADATSQLVDGVSVSTYKAQWKPIDYTITYELAEGSNSENNPTVYNKESKTIVLEEPIKTGFNFMGWYSDADLTNKITEIPLGSIGNKTLYADWEEEKPEVKPVPSTPSDTGSESTSTTSSKTSTVPMTGDNANMLIWVMILLGSLLGSVVGFKLKNKM